MNLPSTPLTQTHARARAAALVSSALECPSTTAFALVETIDLISAAVLGAAGVDNTTARIALAALWEHSVQFVPAGEPRRQLRISDREREFLRDLGERVRMVRGGRRLQAAWIAQATRIPFDQLLGFERGGGIPTILGLYRLAEVLEVPLPLLVDDTKSPLDVLRILARPQPAGTDRDRS